MLVPSQKTICNCSCSYQRSVNSSHLIQTRSKPSQRVDSQLRGSTEAAPVSVTSSLIIKETRGQQASATHMGHRHRLLSISSSVHVCFTHGSLHMAACARKEQIRAYTSMVASDGGFICQSDAIDGRGTPYMMDQWSRMRWNSQREWRFWTPESHAAAGSGVLPVIKWSLNV